LSLRRRQQHTPPPHAIGVSSTGTCAGAEQHEALQADTVTGPAPFPQLSSVHIPTSLHKSAIVFAVSNSVAKMKQVYSTT
jgi:hypothetical protein